ncbi:MAG: 3-hydroxyacyl-CoA dehydrogenase [Proteobacteria bacterium]|nr:3-hydroxyacyl-CoA dehydrogenase [Pseudomonadota bacterium]
MSGFNYSKDSENIVTITMDMEGPVNTMCKAFHPLLQATIERLEKEIDEVAGVIITSAKKSFFAGGDLKELLAVKKGEEAPFIERISQMKSLFRRLEQLGRPVVAAINGAALGGGYELCLACHHRIAIKDPRSSIGLPEVTLGLLPGGGGIVRLVRKLGLEKALPTLLEGKRHNPEMALDAGLIEEIAESSEEMISKATTWIKANPNAAQAWDEKRYRIPGGDADHPKVVQILQMAPAMLRKKTRGLMPAPESILDIAVNSLRVDFDTAQRIETRVFTKLLVTPVAKNMISTFFFQLNELNAGGSRPKEVEKSKVNKVGILGAGMMGQGIAYISAKQGIEVILKDMTVDVAEKGKSYSEKLLTKAVSRNRMDEKTKNSILNRIKPTADDKDLEACDLIIEAVFESVELKHKITGETESYLTETGVFGSNTSTLPITLLAEGSTKPENFIGIHFFSPADKMPLVEIITGEKTSKETLAKAFDYVRQIKKTPIVVNDSRGFFTSRVFSTFIDEGASLLDEGVNPVLIDALAQQAGMPVGPLAIHDEVSQKLTLKLGETNRELDRARGESYSKTFSGTDKIATRLHKEFGRQGRAYGGGYYEYPDGGKKFIWPKLYELYHKPEVKISHQDIKDRFLFRQVIESLRCLEEGVFNAVRDGNIGSIMGIGFPPHTGGVFQYINTYGVKKFKQRTEELASQYGQRFAPPQILVNKAETDGLFD